MTVDEFTIDEAALERWLAITDTLERFGPSPKHKPKHAKEHWAITHWAWVLGGVAFVAYVVVGMWMLYGADYAIGDALARASSARAIAHSRDQHLMAVGFFWMPLPVFAQVPFMAVLSRLGQPGMGLVMPTAFATASTIPIVARIGRDARVPRRLLIAFTLLFAFNPYTIFFAGSGMSEAWQVLALAGSFAAYLRWTRLGRVRDLGRLGLWLAAAQMTRYESVTVVFVFCALVGWQSERGRRLTTAVTVAAPAIFCVMTWTITSFVITRHGWWKAIQDGAAPGKTLGPLPDGRTLSSVVGYGAKLSLLFSPGIVVVIILAGLGRELSSQMSVAGERTKLQATAIVLVGGLFPAQIAFLLLKYATYGDARYFMPLIVLFTIASFVALSGATRVDRRAVTLLVGSLASCVSCFIVLGSPEISRVTGEPLVIRALEGNKLHVDGNVGEWRQFTAEFDRRLHGSDVAVVDTSLISQVQLFSTHPTQIATERDKDSERQLQLPDPGYTWAVVVPGSRGIINPAMQSMVQGTPPRGKRWIKVDDLAAVLAVRGTVELWHLVDASSVPAALPSARSNVATPVITTSAPATRTTQLPAALPTVTGAPATKQENDN